MPLTAGSMVGRYQVRALLGSGGMGEVYEAFDPALGRPVALKVLRPELGADPGRLALFLQEARSASALNHPNILTIYEAGDLDGSRVIVSELVEGETLRQRLERGPLSLREILDIGIQAASALAAAHAASIVHRDIKPDNLMLRPDGYVKVLDFGVATFARPAPGAVDQAATMATIDPGAGLIVGTIAYMSPEQARGMPVDGRSDCYSLGVVLYELVAGRAPFAAPSTSDLLVAILEREAPPLRLAARGLPAQLEWIIEKALEKDAGLRYQGIADLRVDLQRLKAALDAGRLTPAAGADPAARDADQPLDLVLTDDSPQVRALAGVSWATAAAAVVALAAVIAAASAYHVARPGADLPLQLPEGAAVTKARDAVQALGYTEWGPRSSADFERALDADEVARLAGLPAAREAIRDGVTAQWVVGLSQSGSPNTSAPGRGDFAVRLDPRGRLVSFATGVSPEQTAAVSRDRAEALGLGALRDTFGLDASAYQLEYVERAFPAGVVEMTWRSPATRYGHVEQLLVHLQGDRIVRIERSFVKPPGYAAPETPMTIRAMQFSGPILLGALFVVAWGFGLFVIFRTRNWDALTNRLPLAVCGLLLLQNGLDTIGSSGVWQSVLGVVAVGALVAGTLLPALSGVVLWMRRRNPARLWAADQVTHGRVFGPAVSASIVVGAIGGTLIVAFAVGADWLALGVDGFLPTVSREVDAVDTWIGKVVGDSLMLAAFQAMAIALAVETLDRYRVPPVLSTAVVALCGGLIAGFGQTAFVAGLVLVAGQGAGTAVAAVLYRQRGLLATWVAALVAAILIEALAARSLEDAGLVKLSNTAVAVVVAVVAAGLWGLRSVVFMKRADAR